MDDAALWSTLGVPSPRRGCIRPPSETARGSHAFFTSANMFIRSALLSLSALAAAKEMPKDEFKATELYDSGIRHANNVALKKVDPPYSVR
jgi:hypothetical protein